VPRHSHRLDAEGQREVVRTRYTGCIVLLDGVCLPLQCETDPAQETPAYIANLAQLSSRVVNIGPVTLRTLHREWRWLGNEKASAEYRRNNHLHAKANPLTHNHVPLFQLSPVVLVLSASTVWLPQLFPTVTIQPLPYDTQVVPGRHHLTKIMVVVKREPEPAFINETKADCPRLIGHRHLVMTRFGDIFIRTWINTPSDPNLFQRLEQVGSVVTLHNVQEGFSREGKSAYDETFFSASTYHGDVNAIDASHLPRAVRLELMQLRR
jgi:hypothetical protein